MGGCLLWVDPGFSAHSPMPTATEFNSGPQPYDKSLHAVKLGHLQMIETTKVKPSNAKCLLQYEVEQVKAPEL